jgi:hypothetical protein
VSLMLLCSSCAMVIPFVSYPSFNILHSIGFVILASLGLPLQGKLDRKNMMSCLGHPISCLGIELSNSLDCSSTLQVAVCDNLHTKNLKMRYNCIFLVSFKCNQILQCLKLK